MNLALGGDQTDWSKFCHQIQNISTTPNSSLLNFRPTRQFSYYLHSCNCLAGFVRGYFSTLQNVHNPASQALAKICTYWHYVFLILNIGNWSVTS